MPARGAKLPVDHPWRQVCLQQSARARSARAVLQQDVLTIARAAGEYGTYSTAIVRALGLPATAHGRVRMALQALQAQGLVTSELHHHRGGPGRRIYRAVAEQG